MTDSVLLLATGDTIAWSAGPGRPGVASGADLLADLPRGNARVVVEDVLAEPSWDTSPATMLALARRARAALVDDGFDGVVVTHGLDTLEDTAFLADLLLGGAAALGTVVFTGAVRPRDALSADGPRNLASSIAAAADVALRGAGAVVCLGDELHAARWAAWVDARSPGGFSSAPHAPLARVHEGRVLLDRPLPPRLPDVGGEPETDVALIATHPGVDPALLGTAVDHGARGIVLAGTGAGNVPATLLTTIAEIVSWDVPVVVASRARTGPGRLDDLPPDQGLAAKVGAIGARGLPPHKARAALMAGLASGGVQRCREWFDAL